MTAGLGMVAGRLLPSLPITRSGSGTVTSVTVDSSSGIHRLTVIWLTASASAIRRYDQPRSRQFNCRMCDSSLTDAQKVRLGMEIEPDIAARAEKRQKELAGTRRKTSATYVAEVGKPTRTVDEVARTVQLGSVRTYERWLVSLPFCTYTLGDMVKQVMVSHGNMYEPLTQRTKAVIARATKHQQKLRVARLRRRLHEQKFDLRVCRRRAKPSVDTRGQYMVFDAQHNEIIAGAHFKTLEDVEAWIGEPET